MNRTNGLAKKVGFVLRTALLGMLTGHIPYAAEVSVDVGVAIHTESDFYEPLTPHGEWVVVGSYGRCWRPARVEVGWRPYCNGSWQRTDAGWYWVSDEPWGWATYHYGRWDMNAEFGWYWVPQTVWAPSWVSWHEGGGYIGWAPLSPSGSIDVTIITPRIVFVEQRHFLEPIRRTTVVVNNTTIINKTKVINKGPQTEVIEKVTGHKIQPVQVRELRHKEEAAVVVKREAKPETKREVKPEAVQPSKHEAKPETKPQVEQPNKHEANPDSKPEARPEPKREIKPEAEQPAKHEAKPEAKPDSKHDGKPEAKPDGEKHGQKQEKPDKGSEKKGTEEQTP
jgi:hypothetical protein